MPRLKPKPPEDPTPAAVPAEPDPALALAVADEVVAEPEPEPAAATPAKAAVKKAAAKKAAPKAVAIPFAEIGDEESEFVNILYCGPHGTGKTTDLATMANLGPVVFINAEAGLKAKPLRRLGVKLENIRVWPNRKAGETLSFGGIEELFWRMRGELVDNPAAYAGVVWDSVSEIHKLLLEDVVKGAAEKADRAGRERDRFFVDIADYGTMTEQVRFLLRRFRDLPCHFGATALLRRDIDKKGGGGVVYRPAVTPALITDLGGFMDAVCYTSVADVGETGEYRGQFRPDDMREAKDRYGVFADCKKLIDPTFERVAAYVHGQLEVATDPVMIAARKRRAERAGEEIESALADDGEGGAEE